VLEARDRARHERVRCAYDVADRTAYRLRGIVSVSFVRGTVGWSV
jgi:hypothetical protein